MNEKTHHLRPLPAPRIDTVQPTDHDKKARLIAAGGILGALAASTCCILPLLLFSLGISGAWIGQLTALSPYQPVFIAFTVLCLGYGFWLVYRTSRMTCDQGTACAHPLPTRLVKFMLWLATALVTLALAWPVVVPLILDR
jgi:mercuric ion transport protein